MDKWKLVQKFYKEKFGYPYRITDLIAVQEILKESCMGYSNSRIASRLEIAEEDVFHDLIEFLHFSGWEYDLKYSPLALYAQHKDLDRYRGEVYNIDMYAKDSYILVGFRICGQYDKIRKELKEYGY
jgi:hypothetical protein